MAVSTTKKKVKKNPAKDPATKPKKSAKRSQSKKKPKTRNTSPEFPGVILVEGSTRDRRATAAKGKQLIRVGPNCSCGVVDPLNDWFTGGKFPVDGAEKIINPINYILGLPMGFNWICQDWHPKSHASFAHIQRVQPFSDGTLNGMRQTFWPGHGEQNSWGADIHAAIDQSAIGLIFRKGMNRHIEAFSAFFDQLCNPSGLAELLKAQGIDTIFFTGIVFEYCVNDNAIDAVEAGFNSYVVEDACCWVSEETKQEALKRFKKAGVKVIQVNQLSA